MAPHVENGNQYEWQAEISSCFSGPSAYESGRDRFEDGNSPEFVGRCGNQQVQRIGGENRRRVKRCDMHAVSKEIVKIRAHRYQGDTIGASYRCQEADYVFAGLSGVE